MLPKGYVYNTSSSSLPVFTSRLGLEYCSHRYVVRDVQLGLHGTNVPHVIRQNREYESQDTPLSMEEREYYPRDEDMEFLFPVGGIHYYALASLLLVPTLPEALPLQSSIKPREI